MLSSYVCQSVYINLNLKKTKKNKDSIFLYIYVHNHERYKKKRDINRCYNCLHTKHTYLQTETTTQTEIQQPYWHAAHVTSEGKADCTGSEDTLRYIDWKSLISLDSDVFIYEQLSELQVPDGRLIPSIDRMLIDKWKHLYGRRWQSVWRYTKYTDLHETISELLVYVLGNFVFIVSSIIKATSVNLSHYTD